MEVYDPSIGEGELNLISNKVDNRLIFMFNIIYILIIHIERN